jgi:hypothetical protein
LCPLTGRGRLSYQRAAALFRQATRPLDPDGRGFTLHQLRRSRLAHLGEDGWTAEMLMGLSGHDNVRSLAAYVRGETGAADGGGPSGRPAATYPPLTG